jgi:hypothetical protein
MRLGLAANNKKIGTLQVIENIDAARLQGKTVTLSARLKAGGANELKGGKNVFSL